MPPLPRLDEAMGVRRRTFRPQACSKVETTLLRMPQEFGTASLEQPPAREQNNLAAGRGEVVRTYKWTQFHGRDEVTEFDEAHFACEGKFQAASSQGHYEYQDRLRAIHLRKEGRSKAEIAKALGRSEQFVAKWWQKENGEVPRPWGVHEYLTKEMGRKATGVGATNGAMETDSSSLDTATWWRDVEVRRKYAADPTIYSEILNGTEWKSNHARTRDFATGASHLKYDPQGNIRYSGHQGGKYERGLSPAMDKVLQKLFSEYGIADRTSGVITNWYPDGQCILGSHRHDCWTALFSFGHERILTIDNTPLLMQDGDLVIFGTQRHGVPLMPEITEGRVTLVIFFYPDRMQKQGMWQTITDPETMAPSRPLVKLLYDNHLGAAAESEALSETSELRLLQELGFSRSDAEVALRASRFDVQAAAAALLAAAQACDFGQLLETSGEMPEALPPSEVGDAAVFKSDGIGGRFRKRAAAQHYAIESVRANSSSASSSSSGLLSTTNSVLSTSASAASSDDTHLLSSACDDSTIDAELAWRMQLEEDVAFASDGFLQSEFLCGTEDESAALAFQLEEDGQRPVDPGLLAAQFEEYDSSFMIEDAEKWNGSGDLMESRFARDVLSLCKMEAVTLYSVGHGDMLEKDFWEMLQCHSIRVLYDVRPTDYRGEHYSRHQRFSVSALRSQCRARGIVYKLMPLGRESAFGILAHICSDEGQHTLIELAWQGKRRRTAFLGAEEAWRDDYRQVAAEELTKAGHTVDHVRSDGSTERHCVGVQYPDFVLRQEERLKLVEKKRQAGELQTPLKSRVHRSSESVALRLARPAEEMDAMDVMRSAANQMELVVAQRKLARYQRLAEEKGEMASKVVKNVPHWIQEDACKQAAWVAAKKQEKALAEAPKGSSSAGDGKGAELQSPVTEPSEEELLAWALQNSLLDENTAAATPMSESFDSAEFPADQDAGSRAPASELCDGDGDPKPSCGNVLPRSAWRARRQVRTSQDS